MQRITVRWKGVVAGLLPWLFCLTAPGMQALAISAGAGQSAGLAAVIAPSEHSDEPQRQTPSQQESSEDTSSSLVMANVSDALNVRAMPEETAEKTGVLYKDCGGRILTRKNGWTKLQSGDLVGWASDAYLLFDEEAEALAKEVGNTVVTVKADALRVRAEESTDADILGYLARGDQLDLIREEEEWVCVDYEGETAYVQSMYVEVDFEIDEGETVAAIRRREEEEAARKERERAQEAQQKQAEAKKAQTKNTGAVIANADETRLLAALIQCEAGNQPYEGKVAIGSVVMNRVKSGAYPNTISGVIYASGQFSPARTGSLERTYSGSVKDDCIRAAQEALAGATSIGSATHFRRVGSHDGIEIGSHVFW